MASLRAPDAFAMSAAAGDADVAVTTSPDAVSMNPARGEQLATHPSTRGQLATRSCPRKVVFVAFPLTPDGCDDPASEKPFQTLTIW